MLYTSPFDILNLPMPACSSDRAELQQLDKKMLQLKKKQLMAELQLQSSDVITLSGKEFTKNDIVTLFEELEQDDALSMHAAIAADPALLQFLQTGKINPGQKFNYNPLYQEPDFIEFISPYYKEVFNRHILKALAVSDYTRIDGIFGNPVLLTGEDYDHCYGKLHAYLEEKLHGVLRLKESFAANQRANLSGLQDYYMHDWIITLNKLPEEFAGFREDYAIELYNLAVDLYNGKRRDEARALLYGIESIDCSYNIKKLITDLIRQSGKVYTDSSDKSGSYSGVWVVVALVIMLLRIGVTCNRNSSSNFSDSYNSSYLKTYLEEQKKRNDADAFKVGYTAFKPQTKRDKAFMGLLNTLKTSTPVQVKGPAQSTTGAGLLENGSDPYASLFAKPVFKTEDKNGKPPGPPHSAIDIKNKTIYETIVFLYSKQLVKSVYLKPNSNHVIDLPKGTYWAFCYTGQQFNNGLPLNLASNIPPDAKNSIAAVGRFAKPVSPMLRYLTPTNNLNFLTGNLNTSIEETAIISIDMYDSDHFDMQSGKWVTALKKVLNDPGDVMDYTPPKIVADTIEEIPL